ncbi:hypothetical protein GOP47_0028782 [Adiantum capillus-veneris]|nr:hypothetical protein GOP47_0028782 [Adiantum capillus-veneris]
MGRGPAAAKPSHISAAHGQGAKFNPSSSEPHENLQTAASSLLPSSGESEDSDGQDAKFNSAPTEPTQYLPRQDEEAHSSSERAQLERDEVGQLLPSINGAIADCLPPIQRGDVAVVKSTDNFGHEDSPAESRRYKYLCHSRIIHVSGCSFFEWG